MRRYFLYEAFLWFIYYDSPSRFLLKFLFFLFLSVFFFFFTNFMSLAVYDTHHHLRVEFKEELEQNLLCQFFKKIPKFLYSWCGMKNRIEKKKFWRRFNVAILHFMVRNFFALRARNEGYKVAYEQFDR